MCKVIIYIILSTTIAQVPALECCLCTWVAGRGEQCTCRADPGHRDCSGEPHTASENALKVAEEAKGARSGTNPQCVIMVGWAEVNGVDRNWLTRYTDNTGDADLKDSCEMTTIDQPAQGGFISKACYCKKEYCNCDPYDGQGNKPGGEDGLKDIPTESLNCSCDLIASTLPLFLGVITLLFQ